jgi:hypothetical protein
MSLSALAPFLYRIVSFDRLVQMLETDSWHFAHPSTWDDPYEVWIRNTFSDQLFAQCWCRNGVSDAMWRIYSPDKLGVRIRVQADKLHRALVQASLEKDIGFRMVKVKYVGELEYLVKAGRIAIDLQRRATFTRASAHLFLKRRAFEHEAETRIVACDFSQSELSKPKGFKLNLPTSRLIDSVLVDPRAPNEHVDAYRSYLKNNLKFPGSVKKSQLYRSDESREA